MSTGASVIFSKAFGAGDFPRLRDAIHTTVLFALIVGIALGAAGVALVPLILRLLNCQSDIIDYTGQYLRIYIAGILFTAFYNVGAAVLRSVGDSRSPFYALVLCSLLNIVLDIVFTALLRWGVAGVALATVLAQGVSVVLVLSRMRRMDARCRLEWRALRIHRDLLGEILRMGIPAGLQASLIAISNIFVNRYTNGFSSELMAGVGVAQKVDRFAMMPCQSLGLAATTYISQNLGAQRTERIKKGLASCLLLGVVCVAAIGALIGFNAAGIMRLFNRDAQVVAYGAGMMRVCAPMYVFPLVAQIACGTLRAYGYSRQVTMLSLLGMVVIRQIYLAVLLHLIPSPSVIFWGYPVGWCSDTFLQLLLGFVVYRRHRRAALPLQ
jgi:putative MATE family efflux protein